MFKWGRGQAVQSFRTVVLTTGCKMNWIGHIRWSKGRDGGLAPRVLPWDGKIVQGKQGRQQQWKLLIDRIQGPGERGNLMSQGDFELELPGLL